MNKCQRKILQIDKFKFVLTYSDMSDFTLPLDFEPIVRHFNLRGNFVFMHWQAKPVGRRGPGYFEHKANGITRYLSPENPNNIEYFGSPSRFLQIDETKVDTKPTAGDYFPERLMNYQTHWFLYNPVTHSHMA